MCPRLRMRCPERVRVPLGTSGGRRQGLRPPRPGRHRGRGPGGSPRRDEPHRSTGPSARGSQEAQAGLGPGDRNESSAPAASRSSRPPSTLGGATVAVSCTASPSATEVSPVTAGCCAGAAPSSSTRMRRVSRRRARREPGRERQARLDRRACSAVSVAKSRRRRRGSRPRRSASATARRDNRPARAPNRRRPRGGSGRPAGRRRRARPEVTVVGPTGSPRAGRSPGRTPPSRSPRRRPRCARGDRGALVLGSRDVARPVAIDRLAAAQPLDAVSCGARSHAPRPRQRAACRARPGSAGPRRSAAQARERPALSGRPRGRRHRPAVSRGERQGDREEVIARLSEGPRGVHMQG